MVENQLKLWRCVFNRAVFPSQNWIGHQSSCIRFWRITVIFHLATMTQADLNHFLNIDYENLWMMYALSKAAKNIACSMNKAKLFFKCGLSPPLAWKKFNVMKEMLDYFEMEVITRSAKKKNQHEQRQQHQQPPPKNVVARIFFPSDITKRVSE